jgi:hypothetical protein
MNYLTAIIATPLFIAIFLFELYLTWKGKDRLVRTSKGNAQIIVVKSCLVVSFIQMISCFFWLGGFIRSTTDDVLSEALEPHERMDCVGLVGAEWLLAIFQCMFTVLTAHMFLTVLSIYTTVRTTSGERTKNWKQLLSGNKQRGLLAFGIVMALYTVLAWITAINRRCPQSDDIMIGFQHMFYPVYTSIDAVICAGTLYLCLQIRDAVSESRGQTRNRVAPTSDDLLDEVDFEIDEKTGQIISKETGVTEETQAFDRRLDKLVNFFTLQTKITILTGAFALLIFVLQFLAHIKAFSVVACLFCVTMYCCYALRRVYIIGYYVNFDFKERVFMADTDATRYVPNNKSTITGVSHAGTARVDEIMADLENNVLGSQGGSNDASQISATINSSTVNTSQ